MNRPAKLFRLLAFYLPQFHPIPENDKWWGKGFTDWHNVAKARPRFFGHYQPHIPTELGFYDLRVSDIYEKQANLARKNGIDGFVFYHYWFLGKKLLYKPLDNMLKGKICFPFCLCWANESWSRHWGPTYGSEPLNNKLQNIIAQKYNTKDHVRHIKWLIKIFKNKNYISVEGKPVFIIFRPSLIPNVNQAIKMWRDVARAAGIEGLYICGIQAFKEDRKNYGNFGFDAMIEFQPDSRFRKRINLKTVSKDKIFSYKETIKMHVRKKLPPYKLFPCIMTGWDNTARRQRGATIYNGSTPELYKKWLYDIMAKRKPFSRQENFIFVNAWNEWAEGCHLEPDDKWGLKYLQAHQKVITQLNVTIN